MLSEEKIVEVLEAYGPRATNLGRPGPDAHDRAVSVPWGHAAGEEDAEAVVVEVPEAAAGALDLLDEQVGRLNRAVRGAGVVVGEDLGPPANAGS